jgi:DNA-binding MarR family transcriptional regulator
MNYTDILIKIRRIVRAVNLESKRIEKEHGISIPQFLCLKFLYEQNDYAAIHNQIKDYLQLNASTVTGIVSRLEKKKFVAKLPSATDKRQTIIAITTQGVDLLKKAPDPLHEQLKIKLKDLSGEELEALSNAFDTIADFLNIETVDAAPIITANITTSEKKDESHN